MDSNKSFKPKGAKKKQSKTYSVSVVRSIPVHIRQRWNDARGVDGGVRPVVMMADMIHIGTVRQHPGIEISLLHRPTDWDNQRGV